MKIVSMTALSGVGAALSVGVCATVVELNAAPDTSNASAASKIRPRRIVASLFIRAVANDHRRIDADCKRAKSARLMLARKCRPHAHAPVKCELHHRKPSRQRLLEERASPAYRFEDTIMSMRRKAYWWFWFVISGRFLETFLNLRGKRT
jgi:hypothetical protein